MKKAAIAFFVSCGVFGLTSFLVQPSSYAASPFLVNSTLDASDVNSGDGICETAAGNGVCTLRAAVNESNALPGEDAIIVPAGGYTLTMLETYEDMYGGGLYITDTLTISGAGLTQTIIDGGGDALKSRIFAIGGPIQVEISGLTMRNGRPGQTGSGGGVFASGSSTLTLTNVIISGCYSYAAGGIAIGSNLNLISTTLINNRSSAAGGILAGTGSVITITDSAIISNVATGSNVGGGGLIIASGATAIIKRSVIASNTAINGGGGGGIYSDGALTIEDSIIQYNANVGIYTNGPFVLKRSTIDHNHGGGIAINSGGAALINSTISFNTTDWHGGGLYISQGPVTLQNVTIGDNVADSDHNGAGVGGGIYNTGHPVSLVNSIVARNSDSGQAPDCSGILASQDYNLIQQLSGCTLTGVLTHTITGRDPLLGRLQNNGGTTWTRALLPGSPAIDAGDNLSCETTDQRGFSRPYDSSGNGAICDIGAYEAHFVTLHSFLPAIWR
jgi:CSLREA domain-containing protein